MFLSQVPSADQSVIQPTFEKYLVLAADMCLYSEEDEQFDLHHHQVIVSAQSEEDAFELARSALETRAGYVPAMAYTAAELRELADALDARELAPGRAYNLITKMTDEEMARSLKE